MNLIATFLAQAATRRDQIALIDGDGAQATYGEIADRSADLAAAWHAAGLERADRVLLAMGLGIDLYVALAAAWRIGAVVVFPEPALGLAGLRHAARVAGPRAFLAAGWYRLLGTALPELRRVPLALTPFDQAVSTVPLADLDGDHPALISFTSGSTGTPKTIVRSHAFLAAQNACVAPLLAPRRKVEVDLVAFPVFVVANLALGITSVLPNWNLKRHDEACPMALARHIRRHRATRALVPPSICEIMARSPSMPLLDAIFTGGGPVYPDLMQRLTARFPAADIVAVYGSTEAEPIAHLHLRDIAPDDWQRMTAGGGLLAGVPIPEVSVTLVDDEIVVTGDHVNKGYLDPAHDAANKLRMAGAVWHRTGDAGRLDAQGRLWLLGRHEARVGALFPFAVEVAARSWPGVRQAALVGSDGQPVLAIEGEDIHLGQWRSRAQDIGGIAVAPVATMPLDRRHRSKIDYAALRRLLADRP